MESSRKHKRYERIYKQLNELITEKKYTVANMATIVAVLHHKMDYFFWTGFYLLSEGELIVGPYQGPVACIKLQKDTGVCWAGINSRENIIVPDVEKFPGHIACDSRSRSEIVIPLKDEDEKVYGVLDVDSSSLGSFDEADAYWLEKILGLL
jgi:GAF domain-containing protein